MVGKRIWARFIIKEAAEVASPEGSEQVEVFLTMETLERNAVKKYEWQVTAQHRCSDVRMPSKTVNQCLQ